MVEHTFFKIFLKIFMHRNEIQTKIVSKSLNFMF